MKDDPETNIKFVQTVPMYLCLYDYSTKDYISNQTSKFLYKQILPKFNNLYILLISGLI
jgi:hypothetical protein